MKVQVVHVQCHWFHLKTSVWRLKNSEPACRCASLSAAAKLTMAVIVQSYRPKLCVWRVHGGRLFWAGLRLSVWVSGYAGLWWSGFSVYCRRRTADMPALVTWERSPAPRLTALSERSKVCLMKAVSSSVSCMFSALLLTCHKWNLGIFVDVFQNCLLWFAASHFSRRKCHPSV